MTTLIDTLFNLQGQVAFVAGASSGIGASFARALADAGADIVLGARRVERIEALASDIADATGQKAVAVPLDVTSRDSVVAAFDRAEAALGTPTIICNNAGIGTPAFAIDESEDAFRQMLDTNLFGMQRVAQIGAQRMRSAGKPGSIINTASILGLGVAKGQSSYAISKAAVVQMTKAMAIEFNRFGVRVNAICPGYFKTEINDFFLDTPKGKEMLSRTPAGRDGRLEELSAPLLMFAGPGSTFVTGTALAVDGGHHSVLV